MNSENAIEVHDVHKYFKVYDDKGKMLRERIIHWNRNKFEKREVLKGVSFDIKKGEAVGLIGSNGCGKSTTLKLLTKILRPNSGSIEINGKVYSMIELGAGFHPDMSGRENIYINASIFGVKRKEVDKRIDDIIEFSELEDYIDNPVRTYSSGMYMRLAFAVAINMDADILLVDEILAVGDAAFQTKCFNKMREIKKSGTTIVIVSHSLGQIEQLCDRSIWIKDGNIYAEGAPRDIHAQYMDYMAMRDKERAEKKKAAEQGKEEEKKEEEKKVEQPKEKRYGNKNIIITKVKMLNSKGEESEFFDTEDECTIVVNYKVKVPQKDALVGFLFSRNDGVACYGSNSRIDRLGSFDLLSDGEFKIHIPKLSLIKGEYTLDIAIEKDTGIPIDFWREAISFNVASTKEDVGVLRIEHEWEYK